MSGRVNHPGQFSARTTSLFWSVFNERQHTRPLTLQSIRSGKGAEAVATGNVPDNAALSNVPSSEPPPAAQRVTLAWSGPAQVKAGDEFKIQLKVKADGTLRSFPFQASFDPAVLQVVEISEGEFFKQDEGNSSFSSNIDVANGKFFVSAARTDTTGAQGEGVVAAVTLRARTTSSKTELNVLATAPIADGGKSPSSPLPPPFFLVVHD